jgi:hypothetical protein
VLLLELRRGLLRSSLSNCHVDNSEWEDEPVTTTLDRTLIEKRANITPLGREDGQPGQLARLLVRHGHMSHRT